MKLFGCIIAGFILILGCHTSPGVETASDHPEVDYVRDQSLFKQEKDPWISDSEFWAILVAKRELEKVYDAKIRGKFSVAKSRTGYQIDFHSLELKRASGQWHEVLEGFGEIFVSHDFNVQYSAIGP
jgi:hypothetical protein